MIHILVKVLAQDLHQLPSYIYIIVYECDLNLEIRGDIYIYISIYAIFLGVKVYMLFQNVIHEVSYRTMLLQLDIVITSFHILHYREKNMSGSKPPWTA